MLQLSVLSHLRVRCVVKFLTDIWIILVSDLVLFGNFSLLHALLELENATVNHPRLWNQHTSTWLTLERSSRHWSFHIKIKDAVLACVATSKSHKEAVATAHHHYTGVRALPIVFCYVSIKSIAQNGTITKTSKLLPLGLKDMETCTAHFRPKGAIYGTSIWISFDNHGSFISWGENSNLNSRKFQL